MHKLLVFDLDGTLAPIGKGMGEENTHLLQALEEAGYRIAVCSGKPAFYLSGFLRQTELKAPILIGENGATISFGIDLPPKEYYEAPVSERARSQIQNFRTQIDRRIKVYYQPNEIGLTPFPKDQKQFDVIQQIIDTTSAEEKDELLIYRHADSFDFTPKNINKYTGLELLSRVSGYQAADMIAIGDGVNDLPMFEYADISLGIGAAVKNQVTKPFEHVRQVLEYLLKERI